MVTYEIISLDVWGNAREGFVVDTAYSTGRTIEVPDDCDDRALVKALKDAGEIKQGLRYSSVKFEDWGEYDIGIIDARRGMGERPELQLRQVIE